MTREKLTIAQHEELSKKVLLVLSTVREIEKQVTGAYPQFSPTTKTAEKARQSVDLLRSALDTEYGCLTNKSSPYYPEPY